MFLPWRKVRSLGQRGEDLATKFLKREGYAILDRNVRAGRYEIDIVAREGDTVAFVEVKTRRSDDVAYPEDNITHKKRQHLMRAARMLMPSFDEPGLYFRFDVVSVLIREKGKPEIRLFRNAFREE